MIKYKTEQEQFAREVYGNIMMTSPEAHQATKDADTKAQLDTLIEQARQSGLDADSTAEIIKGSVI